MPMEINTLFIVVLVIFAVFMVLGYLRGMLGIIFGVASWVFFYIFVNWASPMVYANIQDGVIREKVSAATYEYLDQKTDDSFGDTLSGLGEGTDVDVDALQDDLFKQYGIKLPKDLLTDKGDTMDVSDMVDKKAVKKAANDARALLLLQVTAIVTQAILRGLSAIIAAVVAILICLAVYILIKLISKAPFLGEANRTVGLVFGACEGLMIVWILMYVIAVSGTNEFGQNMMAQIENNVILKFLYEYNQILAFWNMGG